MVNNESKDENKSMQEANQEKETQGVTEANVETIENKGKKKENKEKKKDKLLLKVVALIALIIIIILLLLRSCGNGTGTGIPDDVVSSSGSSSAIQIDPDAKKPTEGPSKEDIEKELNEKVAASMINISMSTSPAFENGDSEGVLNIVNHEVNNHPQVVEIYLEDTEETIYKSDAIPVGSAIETAKLDKHLEKGTYNCIAQFSSVDIETGETLGKASARITVQILN